MERLDRTFVRLLRFAACVLVVGVLYWAQAVLVPIALALLITFVLTPRSPGCSGGSDVFRPCSSWSALMFTVLGLAGGLVTQQLRAFAGACRGYRANIRQKIADVRGASQGGSVEASANGRGHPDPARPSGDAERHRAPPAVAPQAGHEAVGLRRGSGPSLGPLSTAGSGRCARDLHAARARGAAGPPDRADRPRPTRDHDEGIRRGRHARQPYLLMQSLVNLLFGIAVGVGLCLIGVPYPLLWARARRRASVHPVLRPDARAPVRRSWSASPRCRAGRGRSGRRPCSSSWSSSPISCSRPSCMPAPPAYRRSRCWWPSRSGPGSGGRWAC